MRDEILRLRLRSTTKARIRRMAEERGMTMSELMRLAAQAAACGGVERIDDLRRDLADIRSDIATLLKDGSGPEVAAMHQRLSRTLHELGGLR